MCLVGVEHKVVEFLSFVLWREVGNSLSQKKVSGKGKDRIRRGISRDCLTRELWKLYTSVNYSRWV